MAHASEIDRGSHIVINNVPYRVLRKELVAVGTHSHTKLKVFGKSLFGGAEKVFTFAHNDKVDVIDIIRKQAQVISSFDDKIQIMDMQSYETFDARSDISDIAQGDKVIFVDYQGIIRVIEKL